MRPEHLPVQVAGPNVVQARGQEGAQARRVGGRRAEAERGEFCFGRGNGRQTRS